MDLAERLLYFRALPAGGASTAQELMPLAEAATEIFIRRGTTIFAQNEPPERFVCIAEGSAQLSIGGLSLGVISAPGVVGIRAVVARAPMPYAVHALEDISGLEVGGHRFLATIEDDFALWKKQLRFQNAAYVHRALITPEALLGQTLVDLKGLPTHRDLDLVERMLFVRRIGIFGRGSVNALAELSQHLESQTLEPGEILFRSGDPAKNISFLVHGHLVATLVDGRTVDFLPGTSLGGPESMADLPHFYQAAAKQRSILLSLDLESFFDIVEDNTEMASAFLSGTARVIYEMDVVQMIATARAVMSKTDGAPAVEVGRAKNGG